MSCSVNLRALPTEVLEEVFTPENVRLRPMASSLSTLSFPKSRCALWDGAPTGERRLLHLCTHRPPRVQLMEKALRLAQRHVRQSSKTLLHCFFIGSVSVDSDEAGATVTLDRFDPGRSRQNGAFMPTAALPGDVCVPCVFTSDAAAIGAAGIQTEAELHKAFETLQVSVSGRQSLDLSQILRLRLLVVWTQDLDSMDFVLSWSCVVPATSAHVEPVRALQVIPTALHRSLSSPLRPAASSAQRGFVTMDQTRKLLLLLESDPKALTLPLVGVWVSGAAQVHSPQIWAWILRFLHSSFIQDRAFSESGCFLLLLFASTHRTPQFFQCKTTGAGRELQYQLLTGHHRATLYQGTTAAEGQALWCDLSPQVDSRSSEALRAARQTFHSPAAPGLSVTDQDSGVEDEDLSPRPSPSPHLPPPQTRPIQPSVPELSLLIDGSFSNHDAPPAAHKPQAPPRPDRKCVSPLQLHSTPHSDLQAPNSGCGCCASNNHVCTTIHASPGTDQPPIHQETPPSYQQTTPIPQDVRPGPTGRLTSPSGRLQSPSLRRKSLTNQALSPRTPPVPQNQLSRLSRSSSQPHMTPPPTSASPPQHPVASPTHLTPTLTSSDQPAPQNIHRWSNPAQNPNFTPQQAVNVHQSNFMTPHDPTNVFPTPQNLGTAHPAAAGMNASQNTSQIPLGLCTDSLTAIKWHSPPSAVTAAPSFTSRGPTVAPPLCQAPFTPPPPPVACTNRCCGHQVPLSSGEAYHLLLQQDQQLRLLQQQVQMLLEAQGRLQSNHQQAESQTPTKSTTSVAVGTGASLFWPEPPPLRGTSSTSSSPTPLRRTSSTSSSPPPLRRNSSTSSSPFRSVAPAGGAASPPHSRPAAGGQCEVRVERSASSMAAARSPAQGGLGSVDSPVLGESASMYHREGEQETFYHDLMTQLSSRLREDEGNEPDRAEEEAAEPSPGEEGAAPDRSLSPAHAPVSSSRNQSPRQAPSPGPVSVSGSKVKTKPNVPEDEAEPASSAEDVVLSATLRRLQQLGVTLDKRDLSESARAKTRAVESASTLARINPAAVACRLSAADPSLSLLPHSSADLSLEANAIALRYLSDQQLTRLSLSGHTHKPPAKSGSDVTVLSPSNMSLATRKYMRKYGLIEEEEEEEERVPGPLSEKPPPLQSQLPPQSQLIRELKPKMKLLAKRDEEDEDKENTTTTTRRKTMVVVGNQGSVGNILDLSRLRQLPKLF